MNTGGLAGLLGPDDVVALLRWAQGRRFVEKRQRYAVIWEFVEYEIGGTGTKYVRQLCACEVAADGSVVVKFAGSEVAREDWTFEDHQGVGGWERTFPNLEAAGRAGSMAGERASDGVLIHPAFPATGWVGAA